MTTSNDQEKSLSIGVDCPKPRIGDSGRRVQQHVRKAPVGIHVKVEQQPLGEIFRVAVQRKQSQSEYQHHCAFERFKTRDRP